MCGQQRMSTLQEHEAYAEEAHDFYVVQTSHGDIGDEDLELLARCSGLRVLILDYQQISDLSPLAELPLEYLSLTGNQVSDLSPLAGLTKLQVLNLGENPVRTAEGVAQLPMLREVILEATGVTSVAAFAGSDIQYLNVRTTWVTDYTPLETWPQPHPAGHRQYAGGGRGDPGGAVGAGGTAACTPTDGLDLSLFQALQRLREVDFLRQRRLPPGGFDNTFLSAVCQSDGDRDAGPGVRRIHSGLDGAGSAG